MADALISVLLKQIGSITAREAEQEIRLVVGVDEEVRKLEGNLRTVKAVLNDAEKRQATDEAKDEEENTENAHVLKKKVCSFIPSPSCCFRQVDKLFLRHDIAHKIKELSGKLDEIVRERERYGFELTTRGNASEVVARPITTSFVDVSDICGRDNVRDDLVNILLGKGSEEERSPYVISLVGMGGIGKTTLAQLAYNDPEVKSHFEKRIWVCVSEPFDQCRVAKAILEAFGGGHPNSTELQSLLEKICELIERKKFFLVLDDVWTEDATLWKPFKLALKNGAQGSRILVTTRKIRVAEIMGSTSARMINLEVLSEKDCWLVFSKIAFSGKDAEKCEELEVLGRQIAKKCKGLPLAAKTIGSLMRFKRSREQWKNVLDSNLWEFRRG
uniref:NB-ARC domain-containing protein n=1 Tax=Fagus sylvatica TaxID=28930 RepID=A0A2N9GXR5_FAGSY